MQAKGKGVVKSRTNIYLAGAVSGTVLIIAAVIAFVPLVSLQALREWPISGLDIGVNSHAGDTNQESAVIGGDKAAAPSLVMDSHTGPSVAANRPIDAAIGTTEASGKRPQSGGIRAGGAGSLADHSPVVSPVSAGGPAAHNPGSHPDTGAGATPPTPSTGTSETGGGSSPAVRTESAEQGGSDKAPVSLPTAVTIGSSSPDSSPTVDASFKDQIDQSFATDRAADPPPALAIVVPRNLGPSQPGASAVRKLSSDIVGER